MTETTAAAGTLLALCLLTSGAAAAVPKPTPNVFAGETRLEERITLRIKRKPLAAVLAEIAKETAITLAASRDVADEPAMLHVTEQPAREVLRQIALLF